jgi:hypothetical protein
MAPITPNPVVFRIEWCQRQRTKSHTRPEDEGWRAEEEGLRDALLHRDHTKEYRNAPPGVFERYMLGFQDGQALIRAAWVNLS